MFEKKQKPKLKRSNSVIEAFKAIVNFLDASPTATDYALNGNWEEALSIIQNTSKKRQHIGIALEKLQMVKSHPTEASTILNDLRLSQMTESQ